MKELKKEHQELLLEYLRDTIMPLHCLELQSHDYELTQSLSDFDAFVGPLIERTYMEFFNVCKVSSLDELPMRLRISVLTTIACKLNERLELDFPYLVAVVQIKNEKVVDIICIERSIIPFAYRRKQPNNSVLVGAETRQALKSPEPKIEYFQLVNLRSRPVEQSPQQ